MSGEEFLKKINFSNIKKDKEEKILEIFSEEIEKIGETENYIYSMILYYDDVDDSFINMEITAIYNYSNLITSKLVKEVENLIKDYNFNDMCSGNFKHSFAKKM